MTLSQCKGKLGMKSQRQLINKLRMNSFNQTIQFSIGWRPIKQHHNNQKVASKKLNTTHTEPQVTMSHNEQLKHVLI